MFALFFSLYRSMFTGTWSSWSLPDIKVSLTSCFNGLGSFFTSIFNDVNTPYEDLGTILFEGNIVPMFVNLVAFVLALITSIGIVVMAVKGVKRIFGVFF